MQDLVFPKGNEQELLEEARTLGYDELIYCYDDPKSIPQEKPGIVALIINDRKKIGSHKKKADLLIGPCKREFFEDKRIDAIISPGLDERKDHTHHKRSLTQVEAQLAREQKKTVYFPLKDYFESRHKTRLLGRWSQDKKILEKKKTPRAIVSGAHDKTGLRSQKDLEALWRIL